MFAYVQFLWHINTFYTIVYDGVARISTFKFTVSELLQVVCVFWCRNVLTSWPYLAYYLLSDSYTIQLVLLWHEGDSY